MGAMRWSVRPFAVVVAVVGSSACAQLAGLSDYTSGDPGQPDSFVTPVSPEATNADDSGEATRDDASDPGDSEAAPPGPGDDRTDATERQDAGAPRDAGTPSDANLRPDTYVCGAGTCGGCCNAAGDCVGGQSVATCGVGGLACKDCTSSGACSNGSCATPLPDAGPPPMCVLSACPNSSCFYPIQGACCKSDQTCGCQWTAFAPCQ